MIRKFLISALIAGATQAQALSVNESVVGDFDTTNTISAVMDDIGVLDLGSNVISGSLSMECTPSGQDILCLAGADWGDAFRLSVAGGQAIIASSFTTAGSGPLGYETSATLVAPSGFDGGFYPFNTTVAIFAAGPFGGGDYVVGLGQGRADETGTAIYDWTLELTVAPIPLPAGMPLLAGALGVLVLARRKDAHSGRRSA